MRVEHCAVYLLGRPVAELDITSDCFMSLGSHTTCARSPWPNGRLNIVTREECEEDVKGGSQTCAGTHAHLLHQRLPEGESVSGAIYYAPYYATGYVEMWQ